MTETFPRQRAETRNFTLGAPRGFAITDDGAYVTFLRSEHGRDPVASLWVFDVASNVERRIADPRVLLSADADVPAAELARRERMRETGSGITAYSTDESGRVIAFALGGQLYVVTLGDSTVQCLDVTGPVIDPQVSPDGSHVAWATGANLHASRIDGTAEQLLTRDTHEGHVWGMADFIAAEEFGRQRGFWWAPDSERLLVECVDESPVRTQWLSDPAVPLTAPRAQHYPAAGTDNAVVSLHLLSLDGSQSPVTWDTFEYEYLISVRWQRGHAALVTLATRDQRRMTTFSVGDDLGLTPVLDLRDEQFLEVVPGQPRWMDGDLVSVHDNRDTDTRQLFISGVPVSPAGLQIMAVLGAQEGIVDAIATDTAVDRVLVRIHRDGRIERTTVSGVAAGTPVTSVGADSLQVVVRARLTDLGKSYELTCNGVTAHVVDTLAERPAIEPTVHHVVTGPHAVNTAVLFPRDHVRGSRRLPVMLRPYGGPHGAQVLNDGTAFCEDQWYADQGYVVIIADGRGTPGRGPAWDHAIFHDFVHPVLDDQVAAIQDVAALFPDDVDAQRVGITGWSFGGYLAALAVMERPDIFHAAVAGAPVTDWEMYDTAYTERYLGHPALVPDVYRANSVIARAAALERPLLLVHGLADDNVISAHSLALSGELLAHRRPHSVLPLSGVTHMTPQAVVTENLMLLTVDFFDKSLGVVTGDLARG